MAPDFIREQIHRTRALTQRPFGVNLVLPVAPAPGFEVCLEQRVSRWELRCELTAPPLDKSS